MNSERWLKKLSNDAREEIEKLRFQYKQKKSRLLIITHHAYLTQLIYILLSCLEDVVGKQIILRLSDDRPRKKFTGSVMPFQRREGDALVTYCYVIHLNNTLQPLRKLLVFAHEIVHIILWESNFEWKSSLDDDLRQCPVTLKVTNMRFERFVTEIAKYILRA